MVKFKERRREPRVIFELPLGVRVMTIDGTWTGDCLLIEMTDAGAQLEVTDRAAALTEFFLILNSFGPPVFRHCKRAWVDGNRMGSVSTRLTSELDRSKKFGVGPSWCEVGASR
jgi:hypothetical protein